MTLKNSNIRTELLTGIEVLHTAEVPSVDRQRCASNPYFMYCRDVQYRSVL